MAKILSSSFAAKINSTHDQKTLLMHATAFGFFSSS